MVLLSWGWNQNSQLGHGDSEVRVVPQAVTSFEKSVVVQVVCGSRYTVALTKRGNVFSWGRGDDYQLGQTKGVSLASIPRLVQALEDTIIVQVAARGAHTLALSATGQVYSWGRNDEGQCGLGSRETCKVPTLIESLSNSGIKVVSIACGRVHSVAITAQAQLYTWGCSEDGATGQDTDEPVLEPRLLAGMDDVSQIACGSRHTLVLTEPPASEQPSRGLRNKLFAFGWGTYGQLGLSDRASRSGPRPVLFPKLVEQSQDVRITQISAGYRHSLAIMEFAREHNSINHGESEYTALWAWGWNQYGQLGVRTPDAPFSLCPVLVDTLPASVHSVAGGGRHTLAIVTRPSDGARRIYAFGRNDDGQLGLGVTFSEQLKPSRVRCFGVDAVAVAAGWSHSVAVVDEASTAGEGLGARAAVGHTALDRAEFGATISRSPSKQWLADRAGALKGAGATEQSSLGYFAALRARVGTTLTAGNMDAGFGQFLNALILLLNMLSSLRFRVGIEQSVVIGKIVPGATLTVFLSNIIFGGWAEVLAIRSTKTNQGGQFTALPHGISTVLFFAFTMLIMAPVFQKTGDAELAYRTGLASCFLLGVLELPCLFLVDRIRKVVPRAAMMSAMAGVSLTFIAMTFTVQIFSNPAVAIIPLIIIFVCYGSNVQLPYKIPAGLLALVLGSIVVWVADAFSITLMDPASAESPVNDAASSELEGTFFFPKSALPEVLTALSDPRTWSSITVIIPLLIVNIVTNLSCLEGAAAVGDEYSTRWGLALDALVTIVGALCGNPFPTCIYIGHSAFKSMGATAEYSYLSAFSVLVLGVTNGTSAVMRVVPEVAGVGVLMWIGIVVTAQAFDRDDSYIEESSAPKSHAAAVALGLLPALAAWALQYIQAVLPACGRVLTETAVGGAEVVVPFDRVMQTLEGSGVYVYGLIALSRGYLLSSIFLSSMLVEIIDRQFRNAAGWMVLAAVLSFVGAVHSFELDEFGVSSSYGFPSRTVGEFPLKYAFAYSMAAVILLIFEMREAGHTISSATAASVRYLCRAVGLGSSKPPRAARSADLGAYRPTDRSSSLNSVGSLGEDEADVLTPLSVKGHSGYQT